MRHLIQLLLIAGLLTTAGNADARYLQPDPLGIADGPNTYSYAKQNPTRYTDPTGEFGVPGALIGGGADLAMQLALNGGNLSCVRWTEVGIAAALGSVGGAWYGGVFRHSVAGKSWAQASRRWDAVSQRYRRAQQRAGNAPSGKWEAHHWGFSRGGRQGSTWRNHPANLNPMSRASHRRMHGDYGRLSEYNPLQKWWHGTPSWAKLVEGSILGGILGDLGTRNSCECET